MDDGFVDVYSRETGAKHRVPAHFMTHPTLSKPFRKTPKQRAADAENATPATDVSAASATPTRTETPAAGAKE